MNICTRMVTLARLIPGAALLLILLPAHSTALPRFALTMGARCSSCHVNPTGGQLRNRHGFTFGAGTLPMPSHATDRDGTDDGGESALFDPRLTDHITIGGDLRSQFLYSPDADVSGFHMMTASVYGNLFLTEDISAYMKVDLVNNAYGPTGGPEVYMLARVLPGRWYLKAGDFLPDYGMRIDDHTGFTRGGNLGFTPGSLAGAGLIFTPNYKDVGLEVGGSAGMFDASAGVFNGTGNARKIDLSGVKAVVARVEVAASAGEVNLRLGTSGYLYDRYRMGALHIGAGTGGFALYGEIDFTRNRLDPSGFTIHTSADAMAAFGEADVLILKGLWLTAKGEVFDPSRGTPGDEVKRITAGFEIFPCPFVEIRTQYRFNIETPSVGNNTGLVQLHVWF
ncbi:MAG TPA: hypothetical protein VJO14_08195 [Bacteroidota bacterium]|nr:hypothetical protein [Bacteroidota bacterium]